MKTETTKATNSQLSSSFEENITPEDAKMEQKQLSFDQKIDTAKTVDNISSSQADGSEAAMNRTSVNLNINSYKLWVLICSILSGKMCNLLDEFWGFSDLKKFENFPRKLPESGSARTSTNFLIISIWVNNISHSSL